MEFFDMDFFDELEELNKIQEFQKTDKFTDSELDIFKELIELEELNEIECEKEIENQLKRLQEPCWNKRKNEKKNDTHNKTYKKIKLQSKKLKLHPPPQTPKLFTSLLDAFIYLNIDKTNINLYNLVKKLNLIKDLERLEYYGILELDDSFKILLYYLSQPLNIDLNRLIMFQNSSFNENIKIYINLNIFKNQDKWQKQLELFEVELESIKTLRLTSFQRRLNLSGFRINHKSEFEIRNKRVYAFTNVFQR